MRGLRSTLVLFVVLVGLVAYIWFVERKREPASDEGPAKTKVFSVEADKIASIEVKASAGERTALARRDGKWSITSPETLEADEAEVSGLTTNLATLEVQRVVAEQANDLSQFGLAEPKVEVSFKLEGDATTRRLLLGDKTATGGDMYAKTADQPRVFLVAGYLDTTFDRKTFDLRDKKVLRFDRDKVDAMEIASAQAPAPARFAKTNDSWRLAAPLDARADFGAIEGLIGRLASGQMKSIVAAAPADLKEYGLDAPDATVALIAGSARTAISFGAKTPDGSGVYAKDASRPMVFTVEPFLVEDLKKPPSEFRPKDLFEFRSFSGNRFEIARGGATLVFEKQKGKDASAPETWAQTQPAKAIEEAKILDALSKMSNLRAQSFVDALPAGSAQAAVVTTRHGDGKKEDRVTFFLSGTEVYATRPGEPGAASVAKTDYDDAIKAIDAIK